MIQSYQWDSKEHDVKYMLIKRPVSGLKGQICFMLSVTVNVPMAFIYIYI